MHGNLKIAEGNGLLGISFFQLRSLWHLVSFMINATFIMKAFAAHNQRSG